MILSIDPGTKKCGIAVLDEFGKTVFKKIINADSLVYEVESLDCGKSIKEAVVGSGTGSKKIVKDLEILGINFLLFFEKNSTLEAKKKYFKENRPFWIFSFIPKGLLFPLRPIDDYAAVILGERYIEYKKTSGVQG